MRVAHNVIAQSVVNRKHERDSKINKTLEKLSSGYRINRSADDASGLSVSEKMRAQITGLEQAARNCRDGINLARVGEGALSEVHSLLNRAYELAMKSGNDTLTDLVDREALQMELDSLVEEIDRITQTVNYNGIPLFTLPDHEDFWHGQSPEETIARMGGTVSTAGSALVVTGAGSHTVDSSVSQVCIEDNSGSVTLNMNGAVLAGTETNNAGLYIGDNCNVVINLTGTNLVQSMRDAAAIQLGKNSTLTINGAGATLAAESVGGGAGIGSGYHQDSSGSSITLNGGTYRVTSAYGAAAIGSGDGGSIGNITIQNSADVYAMAGPHGAAIGSGRDGHIFSGDVKTAAQYNAGQHAEAAQILIQNSTLHLASQYKGAGIGTGDHPGRCVTDVYYDIKIDHSDVTVECDGTEDSVYGSGAPGIGGSECRFIYVSEGSVVTTGGGGTYGVGGSFDATTRVYLDAAGREIGRATRGGTILSLDTERSSGEAQLKSNGGDGSTVYSAIALAQYGNTFQWGAFENWDDISWVVPYQVSKDGDYSYPVRIVSPQDRISYSGAQFREEKDYYVWLRGSIQDQSHETFSYTDENGNARTYQRYVKNLTIGGEAVTLELNNGAWRETLSQSELNAKINDGLTPQEALQEYYEEKDKEKLLYPDPTKIRVQANTVGNRSSIVEISRFQLCAHSLGLDRVKISNARLARDTGGDIPDMINRVSRMRAEFGAKTNAMEHLINNLGVTVENLQSAESNIRDTDMAKSMADMVRDSILQQTTQAMLAQANSRPESILQLLQ